MVQVANDVAVDQDSARGGRVPENRAYACARWRAAWGPLEWDKAMVAGLAGEASTVVLPCGSTRESRCPTCAKRARVLRMHQCAEGWHRIDELPDADLEPGHGLESYDLDAACVSLWLNSRVPATQVAEWAGHSVAVLLRV